MTTIGQAFTRTRRRTLGVSLLAALLLALAIMSGALPRAAEAHGGSAQDHYLARRCNKVVRDGNVFAAPVLTCDTSQEFPTWMGDNATQIGQYPLSQVVLPGAHDALTGLYGWTGKDIVAPFQ